VRTVSIPPNALVGWCLVLAGFLSGAALGAGFHREEFLGGYGSLRRRLLRLGHVACVALGLLGLLFAATAATRSAGVAPHLAGWLLIGGSLAMPTVCFLAAWRPRCRALFPFPVAALVAAVVLAIAGTLPVGVAP
jgi:hypothetical protein